MSEVSMSSEERQSEFIFLNNLRDSGVVNMFGAAPYLAEEFGLDRREAKQVLLEWMRWVEQESE